MVIPIDIAVNLPAEIVKRDPCPRATIEHFVSESPKETLAGCIIVRSIHPGHPDRRPPAGDLPHHRQRPSSEPEGHVRKGPGENPAHPDLRGAGQFFQRYIKTIRLVIEEDGSVRLALNRK